MFPIITKWPQSTKIIKIARFEKNIIIGISVAKNHRIENQISFDFSFASINFLYSKVCEFRILINADPRMLSFIILLSQSIVSWAALNSLLTFENIIKNAIQIIGTIVKTARASCNLSWLKGHLLR